MQVLPILFKLWPWVELDPFYAKVKFDHVGFYMGKSENYLFFRNYCSLGSQSCLKLSAKWVFEVGWVSKVKVILWPWSKVTQISKLKLVFLKNSWAIWNQSSYEPIDLETWYVALSMQVLPRLFKLWPWVELDPFYAKVKFDHVGFYMGKIEFFFLETIAALGLKLLEAFS